MVPVASEGERQITDDKCQIAEGESEGLISDDGLGQVVGQDSNLVTEDSTNDKIGILSHEAMEATSRTGQTAGDEQSVSSGVAVPEKAPNEANLEMTKGTKQQRVKTEKRDSAKARTKPICGG